MKNLTRLHKPFWLFTLSLVFGLTLPVLIQDGMFQDAVLYSSVSHNMSQGIGTFWFPQYSALNIAGLPSFHEQPPLAFGIQAVFFKVLGSSIYTERIYTFFMLLLSLFFIRLIWREIYRHNEEIRRASWLPIFFWILVPIVFWTFRHNMHENTMGVFLLLAVWLAYKGLSTEKNTLVWIVLSGMAVVLATLTKGFPGFFPLAVPVLFALFVKKKSLPGALLYSLVMLLVVAVIYGILFLIPLSRESLSIYLFERAFVRIDSMPTVESRFRIVKTLFFELLPGLIITGFAMAVAYFKKVDLIKAKKVGTALFFIMIGLSGTLPLILTKVQRNFYIVPGIPFFALGFAVLAAPYLMYILHRINTSSHVFKIAKFASYAAFVAAIIITVSQYGNTSRKKEMLADVYTFGQIVSAKSVISVPPELYDEYDFYLQGFLIRHFHISIDPYRKHEFFMKEKDASSYIPDIYEKVEIETILYDLYRLKSSNSAKDDEI